ncbi:TPA: DUF2330 domain-containing protein [Thermoplasmata archaeon]|nr:DUF2330 domain-containing protein [Thermoplasmata archaeon]
MGSRVGVLGVSLVVVVALPLLSSSVAADGFWMRYDTALDAWASLSEKDQFAIINYDDGIEKMIMQIQVPRDEVIASSDMVWLFPVPAAPETISLRHFQTIPRLDGDPLSESVHRRVSDSDSWAYSFGTQIYTLPVVAVAFFMVFGFSGGGAYDDLVDSYAVLEQYGVTTEVLEADSPEALIAYLASEGVALSETAEDLVGEYVDSGHSIVTTRISNVTQFVAESSLVPNENAYSLGIGVEFPCDEIFYPLRMTSAYDTLEIPITVQVLGFATPEAYPAGDTLSFTCEYRVQESYAPPSWYHPYSPYDESIDWEQSRLDHAYFFEEQIDANGGHITLSDVDYTVVRFDGLAGALSEDLTMSDQSPFVTSTMGFLGDNPWVVVLALTAVVSCVASLAAFVIIFGWDSRLAGRAALVGAFNLLSLVAFYIAYVVLLAPKLDRQDVVVRRKCRRFIALFSGLFLGVLLEICFVFFSGYVVGV